MVSPLASFLTFLLWFILYLQFVAWLFQILVYCLVAFRSTLMSTGLLRLSSCVLGWGCLPLNLLPDSSLSCSSTSMHMSSIALWLFYRYLLYSSFDSRGYRHARIVTLCPPLIVANLHALFWLLVVAGTLRNCSLLARLIAGAVRTLIAIWVPSTNSFVD